MSAPLGLMNHISGPLMTAMREAFDELTCDGSGTHATGNRGVEVGVWLNRIAQLRLGNYRADRWTNPKPADFAAHRRVVKSLRSNALNANRLHACGLAVIEVRGIRFITESVIANLVGNRLEGKSPGMRI